MFRNIIESVNNTMMVVLKELAGEFNIDYKLLVNRYNLIVSGEKRETCKHVVGNRFCKMIPKHDGFCARHTTKDPGAKIKNKPVVFLQNPYHTSMLRFNNLRAGNKLHVGENDKDPTAYILKSLTNPVIYLKQNEKREELQLTKRDVTFCIGNCLPVCPELLKKFREETVVIPPVTKEMVKDFTDFECYDDNYHIHKQSGYIVYLHSRGPIVVGRRYLHYEMFLTTHDWEICSQELIASQTFNFKIESTSSIFYYPPINETLITIQMHKDIGRGKYSHMSHPYTFVLERGKFVVDDDEKFTMNDIELIEFKGLTLGSKILQRFSVPAKEIGDNRTPGQRKYSARPKLEFDLIMEAKSNIPNPYNNSYSQIGEPDAPAKLITTSDSEPDEIPEIKKIPAPQTEIKKIPAEITKIPAEIKTEITKIPVPQPPEIKKIPAEIKTEIKKIPAEVKTEIKKIPAEVKPEIKKIPAEVKPEIKKIPAQKKKEGSDGTRSFYNVTPDEYVTFGCRYTFEQYGDEYHACNPDEFETISDLDAFEKEGLILGNNVLMKFGIGPPDKSKNPPSNRIMFKFIANNCGKKFRLLTSYSDIAKKTFKIKIGENIDENSGIIFNDDLKVIARHKNGKRAALKESDEWFICEKMGFEIEK